MNYAKELCKLCDLPTPVRLPECAQCGWGPTYGDFGYDPIPEDGEP